MLPAQENVQRTTFKVSKNNWQVGRVGSGETEKQRTWEKMRSREGEKARVGSTEGGKHRE